MKVLAKKEISGFRYEVIYDENSYSRGCWHDWDWDSEEDKNRYVKRHIDDELTFVGLVKYERCNCCESWNQVDSLWSIDCEDPYDIDKLVASYM